MFIEVTEVVVVGWNGPVPRKEYKPMVLNAQRIVSIKDEMVGDTKYTAIVLDNSFIIVTQTIDELLETISGRNKLLEKYQMEIDNVRRKADKIVVVPEDEVGQEV